MVKCIMRLFLVLVFYLCECRTTYGWGEKYGPFQLALNSNFIKCTHDRDLDLDVNGTDAYFYDFTKSEEPQMFPIEYAARGILSIRDLDRTKRFIIFIGGYKSHINKNTEQRIRDTFKYFPNSYLIILDHSAYTNDRPGNVKGYERSVRYAYYIGKAIGEMLARLRFGGISPKSMHCIGHSLGSQILGYTGEIFFNSTGEKIWRITALDPAGPCFSKSLIQEQIRSGVAEYVEVYHCNAGALGTTSVLGDIDFFVNKNGHTQPHCGSSLLPGFLDSSKAAKCSHKTCLQMWTTTVAHPEWFTAYKCASYKLFKEGACSNSNVTIAGFWNPGNATGVYYFSTEGYNIK